MKTTYAFYPCKFGYLKIGYTENVISYLMVCKSIDEENIPCAVSDTVYTQVQEYLDGKRKKFEFLYELKGTEFQRTVWTALCNIPYGESRTYKEVATVIGNPKASRAIGAANHHNPIWIVVPCHRVLGAAGSLTGYAGGLEMKKQLLELEQKNNSA